MRRRAYFLAVYGAFYEPCYDVVNWLEEATPLLNRLTKAYHLDGKIHFPPDYLDAMLPIEAQVGMIQLRKYTDIIRQRREQAAYYQQHLPPLPDWVFPPLVEGATYSHYAIRVPDRQTVLQILRKKGIQLGELIQYSLPDMTLYRPYRQGQDFPNSLLCSRRMINLPIYPGLCREQQDKVLACIADAFLGNA